MGCEKSTAEFVDSNTYRNDHKSTTLKPESISIASTVAAEEDLTSNKNIEVAIIDETVPVQTAEFITKSPQNHSATTESSKTRDPDYAKTSDSSKQINHNTYLMMITFMCSLKEIFVL